MFSSKKVAKQETPAAAASSKFDSKAVDALYESLMDPEDPDMLSMEGISTLCESLGLDPSSDVRVLVLLWKLGASSKPGNITKAEFSSGFQKLQVSSVEKLKTMLPSLDPGFLDVSEFRGKYHFCENVIDQLSDHSYLRLLRKLLEFYRFVFQFSREGTNKTIGK